MHIALHTHKHSLTISYYKAIDILYDGADGFVSSFLLFSETIITWHFVHNAHSLLLTAIWK